LTSFKKTDEVQFDHHVKWRLQWTSGTRCKFTQLKCELSNNFHGSHSVCPRCDLDRETGRYDPLVMWTLMQRMNGKQAAWWSRVLL